MHEFSLCEELVSVILAEMQKLDSPDAKLRKARLVVGALRQIVPDAMIFAFEVLTKGTPAVGATLEIITAPIIAKCRECGWQGEIDDMLFECRSCGAVGLDVVGGKELYLESLEIDANVFPSGGLPSEA